MKYLYGQKKEMTELYDENGNNIAVVMNLLRSDMAYLKELERR